jgi:hypothetical protein
VLREAEDGSCVLGVDTESREAAISYALGLGAGGTALEPPAARAVVAETARAIASLYGSST